MKEPMPSLSAAQNASQPKLHETIPLNERKDCKRLTEDVFMVSF
jgi:hypothetical protein